MRDLRSHPLKFYQDLGMRVTVNTDNRLITDTTMSKELFIVRSEMDVAWASLKSILLNGFKSAFLTSVRAIAQTAMIQRKCDRF